MFQLYESPRAASFDGKIVMVLGVVLTEETQRQSFVGRWYTLQARYLVATSTSDSAVAPTILTPEETQRVRMTTIRA